MLTWWPLWGTPEAILVLPRGCQMVLAGNAVAATITGQVATMGFSSLNFLFFIFKCNKAASTPEKNEHMFSCFLISVL